MTNPDLYPEIISTQQLNAASILRNLVLVGKDNPLFVKDVSGSTTKVVTKAGVKQFEADIRSTYQLEGYKALAPNLESVDEQ